MCEVTQDLQDLVTRLTSRVTALEKGSSGTAAAAVTQAVAPAKSEPKKEEEDGDDDDDFELFDDNEVLHFVGKMLLSDALLATSWNFLCIFYTNNL